ncbi:MAG: DUF4389 domain-containing protein, partial [Actinobacteria bacterium]|nr:DUF4389 domain-containing protein [Actinomycetota bacterium]
RRSRERLPRHTPQAPSNQRTGQNQPLTNPGLDRVLALPQIAIVALLGADILLYPIPALNALSTGPLPFGGYSVLNLLVVVAGFLLLVTGRYPTGYFDFLIGISRWMYRVLIYLALMTDEYPPFRLDAGSAEPEPAAPPVAASVTA